jgi:hypothetical protein
VGLALDAGILVEIVILSILLLLREEVVARGVLLLMGELTLEMVAAAAGLVPGNHMGAVAAGEVPEAIQDLEALVTLALMVSAVLPVQVVVVVEEPIVVAADRAKVAGEE